MQVTFEATPHAHEVVPTRDAGQDLPFHISGPLARLTLLVIDDSEDFRSGLVELLQGAFPEATVEGVDSAEAAEAWMERGRPDIVIADQRLPGRSGAELLAQLRAMRPSTGRILISGNPDLDLAAAGLGRGDVDLFASKPLDEDGFIALVMAASLDRVASTLRERARRAGLLRRAKGLERAGPPER